MYDGASWIAATSAGNVSLTLYEYTATSGQTTFSGADDNAATLSYTVNNIQVVMNGIVLDPSDFTASNGTSVVLATGAALNDIVNIYAFKSFTVADTVSASAGGTFSANVTVSGTVTANQLDTDNIRIDGNTISSTDANGNITLDPDGTGLFLPNRTPCFFAELSADQTINDATETVVQFDNEDFDIGDIWDTTNYRLTVDANTVGYYHISCYLFTSGTGGIEDQYVRLRKNGSVYVENYNASNVNSSSASINSSSLWFSTAIPLLNSGDYADVTVYGDKASGGTVLVNQISTSRTRTYISGFRLGGA